MNGFDRQTLHDLEFVQIREWLTAYSIGETAQQRLADLEPSNDFPLVEQALLRVAEFKTIRTDGESFPSLDFDELLPEIRLLPNTIGCQPFANLYKFQIVQGLPVKTIHAVKLMLNPKSEVTEEDRKN